MRLDKVIKSISVANAAVKNTASPVKIDGWYPAYSASGQDVWLPNYRFDKKGIVVSAVGARCGKAFKADGKWNICANTHALIVDEALADRDYCWYMLNNENWWIKGGSAQPFVKVKDSLKREHNFPPIAKQKIIVQKLNTVASLINLRQKEITILDNLIKSRFVEMFGDIVMHKPLSELCSIITDGTHQPPKFVSEGIPFIFVSNITKNILTYETDRFVNQTTYNELIKRTPIELGDILLSTVGSYGHPAIVRSNKPFLFQRHIAYLKPRRDVLHSDFLYAAILSSSVQKQIEKRIRGVAQKTLNLSEIKKITIPIASMERQMAFSSFLSQINKTKSIVQKSLDNTNLLYNSLMNTYFG